MFARAFEDCLIHDVVLNKGTRAPHFAIKNSKDKSSILILYCNPEKSNRWIIKMFACTVDVSLTDDTLIYI